MSSPSWVKAHKSGTNGGSCVQLRRNGALIEVRDSKNPHGPTLRLTLAEFDAWLDAARRGDLDHLLAD